MRYLRLWRGSERAAIVVAAASWWACATDTTPNLAPVPGPERMADAVSAADSAAIIEQIGGWPPGRAAAPAPVVRCPVPVPPKTADVAVQDARLDSLERVIPTIVDRQQRADAVVRLGNPGLMSPEEQTCWDVTPATVRLPGVVRRLAALYPRHADERIRSLIIVLMIGQSERPEAVRFLEAVARADGDPGMTDRALDALRRMGTPGAAAIRRLETGGFR